MERKLPVIHIEGTKFIVDVQKLALREKDAPANSIALQDMRNTGNAYTFEYSLANKNIPWRFDNESVTVRIPEFVILDPAGMAAKYNCTADDLKNKSDFEIIVDQQAFDQRIKRGMLPTVDIAGHTFYVDIRMDKLRPKDDFLSNGIVFSDIERYYDLEKRTYTIPYNPKTHEFQEPDYLNLKQFPKDLIAVSFPSERLLDRIGWNRQYGFEIRHGLISCGLKLQFTAKQIPWQKTFLADLIKSNLKAEKSLEKALQKTASLGPKQNKDRQI